VLKIEAFEENHRFQTLATYFIDGASFIPIQNNFWSYFTLYEKKEGKYNLIGFCSCVKSHMDALKYRVMISQFIILTPYQRRGNGNFLLNVNG
jgi:histone acetyltransferase 1